VDDLGEDVGVSKRFAKYVSKISRKHWGREAKRD
jgi:hypothetical protein